MNNIHYLIIGLALLFAIFAIVKPAAWTLPVAVILLAIELFSRVSKSLIVAAALALAFTASAQTDLSLSNGLGTNTAKAVSTVANYIAANTNAPAATNWTFAPYYSRASSLEHKNGGGLAAVYYLNPYVGTQIRMQYLDTSTKANPAGTGNKIWLPNGTITLQSAYRPLGDTVPITLRPLVEAGVATDLSGRMYAIAGAGSELDLYHSETAFVKRVSLFYGIEQWQGQNQKFAVQQFGFALNFNLHW